MQSNLLLSDLSLDILIQILLYLDPQEAVHSFVLCKAFGKISQYQSFWKSLCELHFSSVHLGFFKTGDINYQTHFQENIEYDAVIVVSERPTLSSLAIDKETKEHFINLINLFNENISNLESAYCRIYLVKKGKGQGISYPGYQLISTLQLILPRQFPLGYDKLVSFLSSPHNDIRQTLDVYFPCEKINLKHVISCNGIANPFGGELSLSRRLTLEDMQAKLLKIWKTLPCHEVALLSGYSIYNNIYYHDNGLLYRSRGDFLRKWHDICNRLKENFLDTLIRPLENFFREIGILHYNRKDDEWKFHLKCQAFAVISTKVELPLENIPRKKTSHRIRS